MLYSIFQQILNMSLTASAVIAVVLLLRPLFRRTPRVPIAFSEGSPKARIKRILRYKNPQSGRPLSPRSAPSCLAFFCSRIPERTPCRSGKP